MTALFGADNPNWGGNNVTMKAGHARCRRLYPNIGPCTRCGSEESERHHIDGDTTNNAPDNIEILCRRCHMETDGRLDKAKEIGKIGCLFRYRDGKPSSLRYSTIPFSCVACGIVHSDGKDIVRGLCRTTCYAKAYRKVSSGKTTWEELESLGKAIAK